MPVHGKRILIEIIPQNVIIIGSALAEVVRMNHNPHSGLACVLQNCLSHTRYAVDQNHIVLCKGQFGHHISHQLLL